MGKVLRRRAVDELVRKYGKSKSLLLLDPRGMTGNQAVELRRDLRTDKIRLTLVKNSVAFHAFEKLGLKDLQPRLTGMTAIVHGADPVAAAKKGVAFKE